MPVRAFSGAVALSAALLLFVSCASPRPTATPFPTPGPAPTGAAGAKPLVISRGPTPTAHPGSRPARTGQVKMKEDYWLLEAPRTDAQRLAPIGLVGRGPNWSAREEVEGWVRIDAGPFTGWAPLAVVEFQ